MGIQINGQTDIVTSTTAGGRVTVTPASFPSVNNINATGLSTFSGGIIVAAGTTSAPSISPTGDSNTGIFFPAADTVSIAEGGVEALRVDSSSNIGIGTTGTGDKLTVLGRVQIQQNNISNGNNRLVFRGVPSSSYRWNIDNNASSNTLRIFREDDVTAANGAVAVSISTTRNVSIENGNLVFSTAGTGIDFSATANSSGTMTSELFDDYEVGTWTPTITRGSSAPTVSYTERLGTYTKIGRMVYAFYDITTSSISGGSGEARIDNLPFNVSSSLAGYSVAQYRDASAVAAGPAGTVLKGFAQRGAAYIFIQYDNSGANGFNNSATTSSWSSSGRITGYVIYEA